MEAGVFWLAFTFGIHIVLVNLGIGISVIAPILKELGLRRSDDKLVLEAYRLLRFYAATYALGGVFGTAFTVYLLSYYPGFISVLGRMALYNYAVAITALVMHFLSLTIYYYGWNRLGRGIHNLFGALLASSALVIVLGFRSVFAQLNTPVGVELGEVIRVDPLQALIGNKMLPPLFVKSVSAALAATMVSMAAWNTIKGRRDIAVMYARPGIILLFIVLLAGLWYAWELRAVEYKFNNIFGGFGIGGEPRLNLSWLLAFKAVLWIIQVVWLHRLLRGRGGWMAYIAGPSALLGIVAGEYLNAFSQYPYFIAGGLPEGLKDELTLYSTNIHTSSEALQVITVSATGILILAAILYLYTTMYRKDPNS